MNSFLISVKVVIPIMILLLLGAFLRRIKLVDDATLTKMDNLGFRIFLPTQLFYSLYRADRNFAAYSKPLLTCLLFTGIIFALALLIFTFLEKDPLRRGPMIQCEIRINFTIFGMAIATALYGEENTGLIAVLAAVIIPITSTIAAILFEIYRGESLHPGKLVLNILKNPFLIGAALGALFLFMQIPLPSTVENVVHDLSNIATPYCLIVLGGSIHLSAMRGRGRSLAMAVIGKSLLIPAIFIPTAVWMGFRGQELAALAIAMACPTAVSGFTLAKQSGADGELAGQLVVVTTLCSVLTMFLVIWILTANALI